MVFTRFANKNFQAYTSSYSCFSDNDSSYGDIGTESDKVRQCRDNHADRGYLNFNLYPSCNDYQELFIEIL